MPSFLSRVVASLPPAFTVIRAVVYGFVFLWSLVCLAIAVHFQGVLELSDLTRFVPFAIFVCSAGLAIILSLLAFSLKKTNNPISTRIELACLGFAGTLWIALGGFLASSSVAEADVECYAADSMTLLSDNAAFSTNVFHAQYRVLEAFSLFNAALLWGFFLFLLCMSLRQHSLGEVQVWHVPVTVYPWFTRYSKSSGKNLPAPVTSRSRSRSRRIESDDVYDEKYGYEGGPRRQGSSRTHDREHTQRPSEAYTTERTGRRSTRQTTIHDKFARGASPRR